MRWTVRSATDYATRSRKSNSTTPLRAVVLQGAGSHFMAGGDLKTFHAMLDRAPDDCRRLFERFIFRRGTRIR